MSGQVPTFKPGERVRLSELGRTQSPKMSSGRGVVVRKSAAGTRYIVRLDGRKTTVTLHETYIEPDDGSERASQKASEQTNAREPRTRGRL